MAIGIRHEDRLDGPGYFNPWKEHIFLLFEEQELWDIMEKVVQNPTNPTELVKFNNKNVKSKRIILDSIRDHVIAHVMRNKYPYEM